jgi:hypothetical protein
MSDDGVSVSDSIDFEDPRSLGQSIFSDQDTSLNSRSASYPFLRNNNNKSDHTYTHSNTTPSINSQHSSINPLTHYVPFGGFSVINEVNTINNNHANSNHMNNNHTNVNNTNINHTNINQTNVNHKNTNHSHVSSTNSNHTNINHSNINHANINHIHIDHTRKNSTSYSSIFANTHMNSESLPPKGPSSNSSVNSNHIPMKTWFPQFDNTEALIQIKERDKHIGHIAAIESNHSPRHGDRPSSLPLSHLGNKRNNNS